MPDADTDAPVRTGQITRDMVLALFPVAQVLLFLFLAALTVGAIAQASNPPTTVRDTVVPAIGFDDVVLVAVAAAVALGGVISSVRLWLRGSWHVITVAAATTLCMILITYVGLIRNFRY